MTEIPKWINQLMAENRHNCTISAQGRRLREAKEKPEELIAIIYDEDNGPGPRYSIHLLYPSVSSQGDTLDEIKENITECLELMLDVAKEESEEEYIKIPNFTPISKEQLNRIEELFEENNAVEIGTLELKKLEGPSYLPSNYKIRIIEDKSGEIDYFI